MLFPTQKKEIELLFPLRFSSLLLFSASLYAPHHSHSIIPSHGNVLNFQRKFFLRSLEHCAPDPSKIWGLEFKGEFCQFRNCSVSATIAIDRSIFAA
jgi:hypothetical protein